MEIAIPFKVKTLIATKELLSESTFKLVTSMREMNNAQTLDQVSTQLKKICKLLQVGGDEVRLARF